MAFDIAMDINTNDIVLDTDDGLFMIDNAERVAQQIVIALRFWYGEWFLDITDGTPYSEYILVKNPNMSHIRQILTERIQSVEGVVAVQSINLDFNRQARTLTVDYTANTNYGLLTERVVLGYGSE